MAAVRAIDAEHACCPRCSARGRYLRDVADLLGLRDWVVTVRHEPSPAGTLAEVHFAGDRRELAVAFADDFHLAEPDAQRHAVVHELVHPHLAGVWGAVEDGAREAFGGMAYRVYTSSVRREVEKAVDALASVVASHMPEPPE